jgi:phospho-acceptor domain-containing protein
VKIKWPSAPKVLTGLLVVLLPVLAFMQYRWVGQVSEGERGRMQRNLETAAEQFRSSFDSEIGRAIFDLQVGATTVREGTSDQYSERYNNWVNGTDHSPIVADIFLVDGADSQLRLRRWNTATHVFEPSLWPEALDHWRPQFEQAYAAARALKQPDLSGFSGEESLILLGLRNQGQGPPRPGSRVEPSPPPVFGFTVLQLDMAYLRGQMIPALTERHFVNAGDAMFRVVVTEGDNPARVLYESDPSADIDVKKADVSAPLLPRGFGRGGRPGLARSQRNVQANAEVPARWRLYVQHQAGSLEAAVETIRRRNLAISSGILLLLTFAVVMLAATSRRAERLAQQQMEFVAGVSHELRTPVAVVRSAAENLASGVVSGVTAR